MNSIFKKSRNLLYILISLFATSALSAQGWEKIYPGIPGQVFYSNGSKIFVEDDGSFKVSVQLDNDHHLLDIDENSNEINIILFPDLEQAIRNSEGDFVVPQSLINSTVPEEDIKLSKFAPDGNLIWANIYGDADYYEVINSMIQDSDGNYLLTGVAQGFPIGSENLLLVYKTDEDGNFLWRTTYDLGGIASNLIVETSDGGYLISSRMNVNGTAVLLKLDSEGNFEWSKELNSFMTIKKMLVDGTDILLFGTGNGGQLIKTDASGNEIWSKDYDIGQPIDCVFADDGFGLLFNTYVQAPKIELVRTDLLGNIQWQKEFGGAYEGYGIDLESTLDDGFIFTGSTIFMPDSVYNAYIVKTDENGVAFTNLIEGYVQYDIDEDCINDPGELELEDWIISLEGISSNFYGAVDDQGYYAIEVDTGTYEAKVNVPNPYWESCTGIETVSFTSFDTIQTDFPVQSIEQCPLLVVNMQANDLLICAENLIYVKCKNQGTWLAEDVYVEITFDENLEVLDASVPYTLLSGNTYTFEVGDIDFLEQTNFNVEVMMDCDDELLGQTLCSEALIFPDTTCLPIDSLWSGASIEASAWCDGDTVKLKLENVGVASMEQSLEYIVVEDDVIMMQESYGPLDVGGSFLMNEEANGTFYRIESPQVPNHPGNSMPSAFVEACGEGDNGEVSLGFVNQFPMDDLDPFIDILCREVVASYDPNIKTAFPEGYDIPNYIERNTDIEYVIHFQNTGTAPANLVIIQDELSPFLDPTTIRTGASSHSYDFELFSNGIVKFTFENIMLPDSSTNEAASHGFVQFTISQKEDLPIGTEINNEAAILFDFNSPVITNKTLHTIGENFITVSVGPTLRSNISVRVYPNPFEAMTTFELEGNNPGNAFLQLFDALGRTVRTEKFSGMTHQFYKNGLSPGLYFYNISDENGIINSGKVIIQ